MWKYCVPEEMAALQTSNSMDLFVCNVLKTPNTGLFQAAVWPQGVHIDSTDYQGNSSTTTPTFVCQIF